MVVGQFHHLVPDKRKSDSHDVLQIHSTIFFEPVPGLQGAGEKQASWLAFFESVGEWLSCLSLAGDIDIGEGGVPACAVTLIFLEPKVQVGLLAMHQAIKHEVHEDGTTALPLNPGIVD